MKETVSRAYEVVGGSLWNRSGVFRMLVGLCVTVLLIILSLGTALWVGYQPDQTTKDLITQNPDTIIDHPEYISMLGNRAKGEKQHILVFYPGAGVSPQAYVTFLHQLTPRFRHILIVKFPVNLAVIAVNKGDQVLEQFLRDFNLHQDYLTSATLTITGHSLGGAMLSEWQAKSKYRSLMHEAIFLAAYPASTTLQTDRVRSLFLYGSDDALLKRDALQSITKNWPEAQSQEIIGMNHSEWGNYGQQLGDKTPKIDTTEAQRTAVGIIQSWVR